MATHQKNSTVSRQDDDTTLGKVIDIRQDVTFKVSRHRFSRAEALAAPGAAVTQLLRGLSQLPVPLDEQALVISDNGDLYGTVGDVRARGDETGELW